MFDDSRSILSEIETEMVLDGLVILGSGRERLSPDQPMLTEDQKAKYANLFEQLPYWSLVTRNDGATFVGIGIRVPQLIESRRWTIQYTHRDVPRPLPSCDQLERILSCGICSLALEARWAVEYYWVPTRLIPESMDQIIEGEITEEEYDERYDRALNKCFDDGLASTGFDSSQLWADEQENDD